ncbi:hypothetical protein H0H81_012385 [Sphagnurus paluster]|uniref:Major facilitator superfamily (MFS) profile domain-containing protein n=1 Tax=Sphagnurus paluster TaxID=117069 RepID=A0A9P7GN74_9AGAR|nr:hypothetical protein H0H81_012385 [Sphagnurus paluster]
MSGAVTMLIGTAILTSSTTLAQLYVGRIVTGIGNGFNSSSIPVYQSETCGGKIRGTLVCLNSTVTIFGLAYWLDYGMSFVDGPAQWRLPIGFQAVFALCLLLQGMVLPDSPRWLIAHGHKEEGARVIAMLEDRDSVDHPDVVRVAQEIEASLALESAGDRRPLRAKTIVDDLVRGSITLLHLGRCTSFHRYEARSVRRDRDGFFPETHSLELEEIDAIFEKGGMTGGVWGSPGGRTVTRRHNASKFEE